MIRRLSRQLIAATCMLSLLASVGAPLAGELDESHPASCGCAPVKCRCSHDSVCHRDSGVSAAEMPQLASCTEIPDDLTFAVWGPPEAEFRVVAPCADSNPIPTNEYACRGIVPAPLAPPPRAD